MPQQTSREFDFQLDFYDLNGLPTNPPSIMIAHQCRESAAGGPVIDDVVGPLKLMFSGQPVPDDSQLVGHQYLGRWNGYVVVTDDHHGNSVLILPQPQTTAGQLEIVDTQRQLSRRPLRSRAE